VGDYWRENLGLGSQSLQSACEATLDHFQDFVDEMTATPWPAKRVPPTAASSVNPDGSIELFYKGSDGATYPIGSLKLS
jgi:hypothetical protein